MRKDKIRRDKTRRDKTRWDETRRDKTRRDKTRQDLTGNDKNNDLGPVLQPIIILSGKPREQICCCSKRKQEWEVFILSCLAV